MKVLGIDPSTRTGLVFISLEQAYISTTVLQFPDRRGMFRVQSIAEAFAAYLGERSPDLAVIEGYVQGPNPATVFKQVEIGTVLRLALHNLGKPWYLCPPSTLKKYATGNGRSKKPEVAAAVKERWGFECPSDDVVDAYVLAKIGQDLAENGVTTALSGVERG